MKSIKLSENLVEEFWDNKGAPLVVWSKVSDCCDTTNLKMLISSQETKRADRFHFQRDHNSFVIAHSLKRKLLGDIIGVKPLELSFKTGEYGKPELITPQYMDIQFNLSHTNGLVVVAVAYQTKIGVDVELVDSRIDTKMLASSFFSEHEVALLNTFPDDERTEVFFHLWTLKEAFVKADGRGLSKRLNEFYVTDLKVQSCLFDKWGTKLTNWNSYTFQPTEIHYLSVVTECRKNKKRVPIFHEISLGDVE
ncbi:4'-phosphopantetheinyl transferase family protein [Vibrio proteolyticus]